MTLTKNIITSFGEQLRSLREQKKLSLREVASAIGIDTSLLGKIERNERQATKDQIKLMAKFFQYDEQLLIEENLSDQLAYKIIEANVEVEVFLVPRVNTVVGLTQDHIDKWKWNVNKNGWVNWPDYQMRMYKNKPEIVWKNKVHEVLTGYKSSGYLPSEETYALYHPKTIAKQEKQNNYYSTL